MAVMSDPADLASMSIAGEVSATISQTMHPRTFDRYPRFSSAWSLIMPSSSPDPANVILTMSPSETSDLSSDITDSMFLPEMSTTMSRHTISCVGTKRSSDTRPPSTVTR